MNITKGDLEITKNVLKELLLQGKTKTNLQMKNNNMVDMDKYYTCIDLENILLYLDTLEMA